MLAVLHCIWALVFCRRQEPTIPDMQGKNNWPLAQKSGFNKCIEEGKGSRLHSQESMILTSKKSVLYPISYNFHVIFFLNRYCWYLNSQIIVLVWAVLGTAKFFAFSEQFNHHGRYSVKCAGSSWLQWVRQYRYTWLKLRLGFKGVYDLPFGHWIWMQTCGMK